MPVNVQIHASVGSGSTLKQFGDILQKRMDYLNETARGSIAACAMQVLRSLRTVTMVAKATKIKPQLSIDNSLYPSYTTRASKKVPCIRLKGSNQKYSGSEQVVFAQSPTRGMDKLWHVYRFTDEYSSKKKCYVLAAPNKALAMSKAKDIISRRAMRYAGLARRAISVLMQKTFSKPVADNVPSYVTAKANQVASKQERVSKNKQAEGGTYTLTLLDALDYATKAIRGGKAQVDTQMKKAMNKIVSVINKKIPDADTFFGPQKLPTPFPEVRTRK